MNSMIDASMGVLMDRPEDVMHDNQTMALYPEYVRAECTCGYHSPPPGLSERPMAHIEHCQFRTSRLEMAAERGDR
jgi:hypothetical protein